MAQYSRAVPDDLQIADALRRLADYFEGGAAVMKGLTITTNSPRGDRIHTEVNLDILVFGFFEDPRTHPALASQPRLQGIQGGPALNGECRIIEQAHLRLPDNGGEENDATEG